MITIVDYGIGNVGSLMNMFKRIGVQATIESDPTHILAAKKLVLPGVGSFDAAMKCINSITGLRETLDQKVLVDHTPVLGICLGMQLLTSSSEEGKFPGLAWIPGITSRFPRQEGLKVPHMGWNVALPIAASRLTTQVGAQPRYYFVHSYCVHVDDPSHSIMKTHHGIEFDSAIGYNNIYGVQFHPEKSHRFGMQLLRNFSQL